jgi:hypothetical protein
MVMRVVSVLPIRYFVQMPGAVQIKFPPGVAGALHPSCRNPNWNKTFDGYRSANGLF